ncbi:SDR family NAD(P)-dependent oxidoreductase [Streptomyces sp. 3MP-14]|uniref:SDR family NAD(P)-dependent oxidoreductase n=1 Tax=Streptomyces mimosae TaxID=2586635 RepID=A0A5N5ZSH8_9ACTN|nr:MULTISPECIES: SDR family NAD(P)-dependent oxidoreductase [Streptomyces]KAB8159471.1 SDR family NAD(P)-dependent oxidoreductase [Streptomyces mimosae]KAB8172641.1 SDR family NAD(P)-dependent oxidoreductase [Streptomyces sp. 3MP-14]
MALVLVTGASTGLGLATVRELGEAGHDVVLHARAPERLADLDLRGTAREVVYADLSRLEQVVRLAERADGIGRFDAVIHNAGVIGGPSVFAVNVVAPYALAALMTPPRRTVVLSSSLHRGGSTGPEALDFSRPEAGRRPYDDSKLQVTALAMALARLRPHDLVHAVDPGWVPTRMGGPGAPDSLREGHRTQVWLATADAADIEPRTGGYWHHGAPRHPHPAAVDPAFQDQLLDALGAFTGIPLPSASRSDRDPG